MEVLVRDFNCISSVKMDFRPGFNVIQGPSNSGKSSVIKAIEKCIFNQSGSTNVRQGKDNLLVGIKYNDHEVYLTKGKNTKYKVDDQIFEKIGVNQLEQVADALNIREVVLGGEKVRLNFSNQFSYPFLLDKTPGQLYKFIVDSAESESLSDVLKDMSKDIKDLDRGIIQNEAQIDILNKQKLDLDNKLSRADEILDISNKIIEMDSTYTSINREAELGKSYTETVENTKNLRDRLTKLTLDDNLLDNLDKLKDQYVSSRDKVNLYLKITREKQVLLDRIDLYKDINVDLLDSFYNDYRSISDLVKKYHLIESQIVENRDKINRYDIALKEENDRLKEFKVCPLCGGDLSAR